MTEPNKELPKEVVENITQELSNDYGAHVQEGGKPYSLSEHIKDRLDEEYLHYMEYYAPIIEAKDKQIERLKAEKAELHKMVSEKDATISKIIGLLKDEYLNRKRVSIIMRCQHTKKLLTEVENEFWADYCKSHGIDLGGE